MADTRTMAELLRAPTEGDAEAIVVPPIPVEHFELKHSILNLVTSKQFFGFEKEDPHAHIRWFNKITSMMKYKDVPETAIKLMLFPFSIDGPTRIWLEKEPPRSIETWDDLVSKFINKFFPPSKTTNLQNEISNFQQRFDEPFHETWDRFKDLLRACPHHGFTELHQLDTFYNSLNLTGQDSLNSATGVNYNQGNAGHRPPSVAHQVRPPGFPPVHNNQNRGNNYNPGNSTFRAATPPTAPSNELANYMKVNETSINTVNNPKGDLKAITTQSGVSYDEPTIPPPFSPSPKVVEREPEIVECLALADLGASFNLMTLSIWEKLSLPELTPTQMILELADRSTTRSAGIAEDVFVKVGKFHFLADFVVVDYVVDPRVPLILGRPFLRMARALIDVYGEELTLRVDDEAITFKVGQTSRYSYNDAKSVNQIDVIDVSCEKYAQEVLRFTGNSESGNPTPISEPIIAKSSPSLTPFEGGDFIIEEIKANLASDSVPPGIDSEDISELFSTFPIPMENCDFFFKKTKRFTSFPEFENLRFDIKEKNSNSPTDHADVSLPEYERFYSEGDIRLLEKFLNDDPSSPLPPKEIKTVELKNEKSSVDEPSWR
ncbi:reverse transcriptase domain-containing protein [Tanacetum coccineum]